MVTEKSACWDIAAVPFWPPSGHHALALLPSSSTTGSAVCRRAIGVAGAAAATTTAADEEGMAAMEPPGVEQERAVERPWVCAGSFCMGWGRAGAASRGGLAGVVGRDMHGHCLHRLHGQPSSSLHTSEPLEEAGSVVAVSKAWPCGFGTSCPDGAAAAWARATAAGGLPCSEAIPSSSSSSLYSRLESAWRAVDRSGEAWRAGLPSLVIGQSSSLPRSLDAATLVTVFCGALALISVEREQQSQYMRASI